MRLRNKLTGEVVDVPDTSYSAPEPTEQPVSLYDYYRQKEPATLASQQPDLEDVGSYSAPKPPKTWGQFGANVKSDISSLGEGLKMLPSLVTQQSVGGQFARQAMKTPGVIQRQVDILTKPGEQKLQRMVGEQMKASPQIEQAKLLGITGKSMLEDYWKLISDPANAFYEHPVNSTIDALTLMGVGTKAYKMAKANFNAAQKTTELANTLKVIDPKSATIAQRTFSNVFTIPTKRAKDLRPLEVSKKMLDYGVKGSLDDMKSIANTVTGKDGVLSKVTREAVGRVPGEITLQNVQSSITNMGSQMLDVTPDDIQRINVQIATKMPIGKGITSVNPLDAYDLAKQLERQAADLARRSTYLTPNLRYEQLAKLYRVGAEEIISQISDAVKGADVVAPLKTPEVVQTLTKVSPKLAKEFMAAKTFEDLRGLQAPFVKLSQMVDLSLDAELSAARKLGVALGGRLGATLTGGAVAGLPGMLVGSAVGPALEPLILQASQTVAPKILTKGASALQAATPAVQRASATARALGTGTKSAAAAAFLRKLMQYYPENQPLPISTKSPANTPIPTQAMTGSMREWTGQ